MPRNKGEWCLRDVVDFETEAAAGHPVNGEVAEAVRTAAEGLDGAAARRAGLRVWLDAVGRSGNGAAFAAALGMAAALLAAAAFLTGIGVVSGLRDGAKGGVHVSLFLAVIIGGQWLLLLVAGGAWLARGRAAGGLGLVRGGIARLARRFAGPAADGWWRRLVAEGGGGGTAMLWRVGRIAQAAGVCFNLGVLAGLGGLVMLRHVGFFWETTTEVAMHSLLERACGLLAVPWAAWWPEAVPDAGVIAASRWLPGREAGPGPAEWWRFLLMATLVWGLLPRVALWLAAWRGERAALAGIDFQSRHHRALWRELTSSGRVDADDLPPDGVLVLDVGGSGLPMEGLRPFLLRRMRVNPTAWHSVAVLDEGEESAAAMALAKAPAGLVFLAEGWALSPARMAALHARARKDVGPRLPIRFLVVNAGAHGGPESPTAEEWREWERFTDGLRDPETEVVRYVAEEPLV